MIDAEIKKAIGNHGLWKGRLANAIGTGKSEFTADGIVADNQCDFGKWLYGTTIPAPEKSGDNYKNVRRLHEEFHKLTGEVLKLALEGKKDEANKLIEPKGRYATVSAQLTSAMMKWASASR